MVIKNVFRNIKEHMKFLKFCPPIGMFFFNYQVTQIPYDGVIESRNMKLWVSNFHNQTDEAPELDEENEATEGYHHDRGRSYVRLAEL